MPNVRPPYDLKTGTKFGPAWKRRRGGWHERWSRKNYRPLDERQRELACLMVNIYKGAGINLWMQSSTSTDELYDIDPPPWAWYWWNRMYAYDGDLTEKP